MKSKMITDEELDIILKKFGAIIAAINRPSSYTAPPESLNRLERLLAKRTTGTVLSESDMTLLVFRVIASKEMDAVDLVEHLAKAGVRLASASGIAVYRILDDLELAGFVTKRKILRDQRDQQVYVATDSGRRFFTDQITDQIISLATTVIQPV